MQLGTELAEKALPKELAPPPDAARSSSSAKNVRVGRKYDVGNVVRIRPEPCLCVLG